MLFYPLFDIISFKAPEREKEKKKRGRKVKDKKKDEKNTEAAMVISSDDDTDFEGIDIQQYFTKDKGKEGVTDKEGSGDKPVKKVDQTVKEPPKEKRKRLVQSDDSTDDDDPKDSKKSDNSGDTDSAKRLKVEV